VVGAVSVRLFIVAATATDQRIQAGGLRGCPREPPPDATAVQSSKLVACAQEVLEQRPIGGVRGQRLEVLDGVDAAEQVAADFAGVVEVGVVRVEVT
jgi:hypothetical protein